MDILNKKVYRELFRHNKARSFAIVLTLTLTVGFLFGLANSKDVFFDSYDLNMEKLNTPEARLQFKDLIDASNLTALESNQKVQNSNIRKIEGRLYLPGSQVIYKGKTYDAIWIALNSTKNKPNDVDKLRIVQGNNYFENENDSLIIFQFATGILGHGANLEDSISIKYENTEFTPLTLTGIVQSNEYTYVVDQNNIARFGDLAIIYTSLDWAWKHLNSRTNVINQMLVDTNELSQLSAANAVTTLLPILTDQNAEIYTSVYSWDTPDYKFFNADAGSVDKFSVVLGGFALIVGIILVYNTLTKLINSQRKHIGLLGAMGSNRRAIVFHYMSIGAILSLLGIIFGIIFSFVLTYLMALLMLGFYGFHWITITFNPSFFLLGTVITLLTILFFSLLACYPVLNITPREAMTSTFTRTGIKKQPLLEKVFKKIPGFKSISTSIPLRETFMNKKRSSLTIIAIGVSSIILIISGAFVIDMLYGLENNSTVYNQYDGRVILNNVVSLDDLNMNLTNYNEFDSYEPLFYVPVFVNNTNINDGNIKNTFIEAVPQNSDLRHYHIASGRLPLNNEEILIGYVIANDLNISINDQVNLFITDVNLNLEFTVVGIVGELIDVQFYTYIEFINEAFNFPGVYADGFMFTLKGSYSDNTFTEIQDSIYENFSVNYFENAHKTQEATRNLLEVIMELSSLFMVVGVFMVIAFTFNTIYIAYSDREMEYLALRAQGMKRRTLLKIIGLETTFFGIIGFLISIPIGYAASFWSFDYMLGGNWYIELIIPIEMWFFLCVMTILSVLFAAVLVSRRINKAKMPDMLRNRQIG